MNGEWKSKLLLKRRRKHRKKIFHRYENRDAVFGAGGLF
jgi:hypothetical protein